MLDKESDHYIKLKIPIAENENVTDSLISILCKVSCRSVTCFRHFHHGYKIIVMIQICMFHSTFLWLLRHLSLHSCAVKYQGREDMCVRIDSTLRKCATPPRCCSGTSVSVDRTVILASKKETKKTNLSCWYRHQLHSYRAQLQLKYAKYMALHKTTSNTLEIYNHGICYFIVCFLLCPSNNKPTIIFDNPLVGTNFCLIFQRYILLSEIIMYLMKY